MGTDPASFTIIVTDMKVSIDLTDRIHRAVQEAAAALHTGALIQNRSFGPPVTGIDHMNAITAD